ncbi:MAG: AI-2E family transporter [Hyphomicrobiales bacterium]|uniref:AI-2E family transporter n=1 Tax=Rhabdaerophilum calidifontis TaxID=2604328 RepID=UPI00123A7544|nr:AI-2E family transporter [Rhabdaerophilum calidifontis]MCA1953082.1 AI-2E family transporter [Hyphomicrobiales bacterium]MCA1999045.1 AI-2E family transporter [Hyphomicrobiales bacterium]
MTLQRQIGFWSACLAGLILFLWLFSGILMPFVAALILAYLLDPLVDLIERTGIGRLAATCFVLLVFVLFFILMLIAAVPLLGEQITALSAKLPGSIARLQRLLAEQGGPLFERFGGAERLQSMQASLAASVGDAAKWLAGLLTSLLTGGQAILGLLSLLVLTPVIAFYMILDWDRMVATVDSWLPRQHRAVIRELVGEMDQSVAGFLRGQATICVLLGLFYAVGLSLVGLHFGFLIGIIAGLINFIPYVGSLTGLVLSVGVAFGQFWPEWSMIVVVAAIFAAGQFIEGNVLQPKLLGKAVGLHPVWLMFALLAFGSLFGFVGVMLAVPLAAVIGVLVRFALRQYLASRLYSGGRGAAVAPPSPARDTDS